MRSKYTSLFLLFAIIVCSPFARAQVINTYAGNGFGASTGSGGYSGDGGQAKSAELNQCTAVAFDGAGNIYIADRDNNVIRKVSYLGVISTFAGTGTAGYSGDKFSATLAQLNQPYGVAVDVPGNVYVADYGNNVVRKISTAGVITTYAGTGVAGYSGDNGAATAALMNNPQGIATDQDNNVYVTEAGNHVVREITVDTMVRIKTIAGNGTFGYSGNGGNATQAQLYGPAGVTVDVYGNVYIADYFNNVVRKVDVSGIISNYAGNNIQGNSGDGGPATSAELYHPSGVSVYGHGHIYISDQHNNTVRSVDASGIITRYAGTTTNGYTGDGGQALLAELSSPKGLAVDGLQRVYIVDYDNNVVRLVDSASTGVKNTATMLTGVTVYPNPTMGSFIVDLPATTGIATVNVMDITGRIINTKTAKDAKAQKMSFNLGNVPEGSYFVQVIAGGKTYSGQVILAK